MPRPDAAIVLTSAPSARAGERRVRVPVALGREAVAVGERAEDAVPARDRIADDLDEAARAGGRSISVPVADVEREQARLALRTFGLAIQLDGVNAGGQPGREHDRRGLPAVAVNGAWGVPSTTALKIADVPVD